MYEVKIEIDGKTIAGMFDGKDETEAKDNMVKALKTIKPDYIIDKKKLIVKESNGIN